ncbi:MAG: transglutaminase domain-containing protein [Saprospiraceae bacterium]
MNLIFRKHSLIVCHTLVPKNIFLLLILFISTGFTLLYSQTNKYYKSVDKIIKECPLDSTNNIHNLADFINDHFTEADQKIRAVYVWVAQNITYDVENIFEEKPRNPILETRKGTCQDFSNLFKNIANAVGLETYTVQGYTKQNNVIVWQPHAWVVSKLNGEWYFFDPTWAAGFVEKGRFYRKFDDSYFKVTPQEFIKSHFPYDPLWQILIDPISPAEFDENIFTGKKIINHNFTNELYELNSLDEIEQLKQEVKRIENIKISNFLLYFVLREKKAYAKAKEHQLYLDKYNQAEYHYEEGVFLLNEFIIYRNKFFEPYESDLNLKKRIGGIIDHLETAQELLEKVDNYPEGLDHVVLNLSRALELAFVHVNEHKDFVKLYTETPEDKRLSLFYD